MIRTPLIRIFLASLTLLVWGCTAPSSAGPNASAQQTQVAGLVNTQMAALPTATPSPTPLPPTATPSATPTALPTPLGGGGQLAMTFFTINGLRQMEVSALRVTDAEGRPLLEEQTQGALISVSHDRTRIARLVEDGIEIFSPFGGSTRIAFPEVSSVAGVGSLRWLPGDERLIVQYHRGFYDGSGRYAFDYYLVDLPGGTRQVLFSNRSGYNLLGAAPDGAWLAVSPGDETDFLSALDGSGARIAPAAEAGKESSIYRFLGWDAAGSATYWLVYATSYGGLHELVRMDMADRALHFFGQDADFQPACVPAQRSEKIFCGGATFNLQAGGLEKTPLARPPALAQNDFLLRVLPSPDESKLLVIYMSYATQARLGFVYSLADGSFDPLDFMVTEGFGGWSPDGKLIYGYSLPQDGVSRLILYAADAHARLKELPAPAGSFYGNLEWLR